MACPCSSKHITTTAAPYRMMSRAWLMNSSSPFFSDIELTIPFPWIHFRPAVITSHFEESIIIGTLAISGSPDTMRKNRTISALASSSPSSILTSMTSAPSSTCFLAMDRASSYFFSLISLRNFLLPATLHLSPTLLNVATCSEAESTTSWSSNPDRSMWS